MNTIFEKLGGTHTKQGDYILPNIATADEDERTIGIWGERRRKYLKEHHRILYYNLLTSGELYEHLAEIDKQAEDMFFRLVKQMAEREGVTEKLKAKNQLEWVSQMNNIRSRATDIINSELIYT